MGTCGTVKLCVNGVDREITSDAETPLIYVLRDELKLKGTKLGCGLEMCGSCAVMVDGKVVLSCVSPAEVFAGKEITTIEAIGDLKIGRRVQDAFVEASAAQCGYCTAGLVVAATALLQKCACPDRAQVIEALNPHLCRCGSHPRVFRAVQRAAAT